MENFGLQNLSVDNKFQLHFLPSNLINLIEYHRGLNDFDKSKEYFLYTGRGPSNGSFHIGHLPGLKLILAFQQQIKNKIFFMISDDEKIFRDSIDENTMKNNVTNTIKQLNNLGFSDLNTNFHLNSDGISKEEYSVLIQLLSKVNINQLNHIFGEKSNVGEYFYPLYQILPCFLYKDKQCIVIAGKDQDPFFRLARDLADKLGFKKPIIIYTKSVLGLDGSEKMSTSVESSLPIFLNDSSQIIKEKVFKIKKVGAGTLEELFLKGANLDEDIPFKLISIFDTNETNLKIIKKAYTFGLTDNNEINYLKQIIPQKGMKSNDEKTMLTTFGIRSYLSDLLTNLVISNTI
jgi:tryptophanyl-tRNA synthetase